MWIPPSPLSLAAFLAIVSRSQRPSPARCSALASARRRRRRPRELARLLAFANGSGVLEHAVGPVPGVTLFLVASLGVALVVSCRPIGAAVARTTPLWALVLFQAFRLPLELVLHAWAGAGHDPAADDLERREPRRDHRRARAPGSSRGVPRPHARRGRGLRRRRRRLLLNVLRVALLSTPGPFFSYTDASPLLLAFHFPTGWIVPVCVGGALAGHVVLTRALLAHLPRRVAARA
jgi:hypothetical protein